MTAALQAVHDIAESTVWDTHFINASDAAARLIQMERGLGQIMAIRTLASKFADGNSDSRDSGFGSLIERGIVWTTDRLGQLESSKEVREVWLLTHDLEPDLSASKTISMVKSNLASGKRYTYFYPADLREADSKMRRLRRNVGAGLSPPGGQVRFVPMSDSSVFTMANVIMFFSDDCVWH